MSELIERRKKDRRINDRRNHHHVCDDCSGELIYLLPDKIISNECYECKRCGQKYVVLKFKGMRDKLTKVTYV